MASIFSGKEEVSKEGGDKVEALMSMKIDICWCRERKKVLTTET